jgi:esterase/lipase superfamily enzyme
MEILSFGHAGARVLVFPTSTGRFFDWENRGMVSALQRHIDEGWLQLFCIDSVDPESWFNHQASHDDKAHRHYQYQHYIIDEVVPFTKSKNSNDYLIATGASFGAYHSASIALRYPNHFNRVLAMSGIYDVREWTQDHMNDWIHQASPCEFIKHLNNPEHLEQVRKIDWIIPIGHEDPLYENNKWFSQLLWDKGIWHSFRVWDCNGHDWPYWHDMIQQYIGGAN